MPNDALHEEGTAFHPLVGDRALRVAGLKSTYAANIVAHRNEHGSFRNRGQIRKVPRAGEKTSEQAAGFLRVMTGHNPLDASAVRPESYEVVERIVSKTGRPVKQLIGKVPFS